MPRKFKKVVAMILPLAALITMMAFEWKVTPLFTDKKDSLHFRCLLIFRSLLLT
jgi:hypothetical protein